MKIQLLSLVPASRKIDPVNPTFSIARLLSMMKGKKTRVVAREVRQSAKMGDGQLRET